MPDTSTVFQAEIEKPRITSQSVLTALEYMENWRIYNIQMETQMDKCTPLQAYETIL